MKRNFLKYVVLALILSTLLMLGACGKPKPLAVGDTFELGSITVKVVRLDESMASRVVWSNCHSGMKFVMVELDIIKENQWGDFDSRPIFLEFSSGNVYGPPTGYYVMQSSGEKWEYEWIMGGTYYSGHFGGYEYEDGISAVGDLNLLFQVDQNESLDTLIKLGYTETAPESQ